MCIMTHFLKINSGVEILLIIWTFIVGCDSTKPRLSLVSCTGLMYIYQNIWVPNNNADDADRKLYYDFMCSRRASDFKINWHIRGLFTSALDMVILKTLKITTQKMLCPSRYSEKRRVWSVRKWMPLLTVMTYE